MEMELEIIEKNVIELEVVDVEKYNPYHDSKGRFTSPGGAASFTIGNKSGLAWNQKNVDRAIEREKQRTAEQPKQKKTKEVKSYADVKTKQDFVDYVEHRHGLKLDNDKDDVLNKKRDVLYSNIPREKQHEVLNDFNKHGIRYESHMKDNYFIYFKSGGGKSSSSKIPDGMKKEVYDRYKKDGFNDDEIAGIWRNTQATRAQMQQRMDNGTFGGRKEHEVTSSTYTRAQNRLTRDVENFVKR